MRSRWLFISRTLAILRKEVIQLRRDRLTFGMILGIPALQLTLFGYAIDQDVRHIKAAVVDVSGSAIGRAIVADAESAQVVEIIEHVGSVAELEERLRTGKVSIGIVIPVDVERRLADPTRAAVQLLVDGSDPTILATARSLARMPVIVRPALGGNRAPPADIEVRAYYNPENRSEVFIVPGLLGVILTMTMVLFTSVAIVRERERGNFEFLITTPVRVAEILVGKIIPYVVIGYIQVSIILLLGRLLFRVPLRGSLGDLLIAAGLFIVATLTLGLLISTVAQSQFQAMQLTFFVFLPSILLSGFMFPFDGMPQAAQWIAELLPLTHFNRISRGIVLRGASLYELRAHLRPLLVFFVVVFAVAALRFQKRLD